MGHTHQQIPVYRDDTIIFLREKGVRLERKYLFNDMEYLPFIAKSNIDSYIKM